jgi:polyisoprenyl-phosphate glycosyltransferase
LASDLALQARDNRNAIQPSPPSQAAEREPGPLQVAVVVPVYKDWPSLAQLLGAVDALAAREGVALSLVVINDEPASVALIERDRDWAAIHHLEVLHLTRNLGHQRAIAVGLAHVEAALRCDCVVVMDADGEDRPEDVVRLIEQYRDDPSAIIVAERRKRSEGAVFRSSYRLYKGAFRLLTGQTVDFGNFSLIPRPLLVHLVSMSEIWSNFPAGIIQSRLPVRHLPTERGRRYQGRSTMNFIALIMHGLGAISVFSDAVFIRVTLLSFAFLVVTCAAILTVLMLKLTGHATPGWASNLAVSLSILAVQMVMLSVVAAFMVLNNRTAATVIPRLSYRNFVLRREVMWTERAIASARAIA